MVALFEARFETTVSSDPSAFRSVDASAVGVRPTRTRA
jgi:hypothetical protein